MEFTPGTWINIGLAIFIACFGLSFVVKAFKGHRDCQCESYDLDQIEADADALRARIAELERKLAIAAN